MTRGRAFAILICVLASELFVFCFLLRAPSAAGASLHATSVDSDLDPSFGNSGVVTTAIPGQVTQLVGQGDKIIAIGSASVPSGTGTVTERRVARFNADGSLDNTYGNNGVIAVNAPFSLSVNAVAVQGDGKVILAGSVPTSSAQTCYPTGCSRTSVAVARLNTDGTIDASFGASGLVTRAISITSSAALTAGIRASYASVAGVRSDGKILVAGNAPEFVEVYVYDHFFILGYDPDGTPDNGFGAAGLAYAGGSVDTSFTRMLFDANDNVVLLWSYSSKYAPNYLGFNRFAKNGSYLNGGNAATCFRARAHGGAVYSDGKVIVGGPEDQGYALCSSLIARFTASGSLDTSFGASGKITNALFSEAFATQRDDKLLVAGTYSSTMMMARYGADGSLDTGFGSGGYASSTISESNGGAVAVQLDGRILVGGSYKRSSDSRDYFLLTRYMGTPVAILKTYLPLAGR